MTLTTLRLDTPVGQLLLQGNEHHLTHLLLPEAHGEAAPDTGSSKVVKRAATQLREYFAGRRHTFDLPLAPAGSAFQRDVWQALQSIPYGETASYGEIAREIGRPSAFRAVGQANGANPIAIVIPCHRVLAGGGKIGGYGGGLPLKRALLELEGVQLGT